jgi:hypothetical protein
MAWPNSLSGRNPKEVARERWRPGGSQTTLAIALRRFTRFACWHHAEHHAGVGQFAAGEGSDILPGQSHFTLGGFGDADDDAHHGGLATTVGAQNHGILASRDRKANLLRNNEVFMIRINI